MITRRLGLQWMAAAAAILPQMAGRAMAQTAPGPAGPALANLAPWPAGPIAPLGGPGYGSDPDLMNPKAPWPLTLTGSQKNLVKALADLILPDDGESPGAGEAGVADFIDEWISAPYPAQSDDRDQIVRGLVWLDAQSGGDFSAAAADTQAHILDAIFASPPDASLTNPAAFAHRLRTLIVLGFYTMPVGRDAIGYIGNQPVKGGYPGPSEEALVHFQKLLITLDLKDPGQPWETA